MPPKKKTAKESAALAVVESYLSIQGELELSSQSDASRSRSWPMWECISTTSFGQLYLVLVAIRTAYGC